MVDKIRFCIVCKQEIEPERREGLPETELCIQHGREITKYGGEFIVSTFRERTNKPGSLKRNYGGVEVSKRRNQTAIDRLRQDYLDMKQPS